MKKLTKKNVIKKNITKKKVVTYDNISYKPFEKAYSKTLAHDTHKKGSKNSIKIFLKRLSADFRGNIERNDDFYTFVNQTWLRDKEVDSVILDKRQKYITQVDNFRLIQDKVYYELYDIMKDYCNKNHTRLSSSIRNFYTSAMKLNPIQNSKTYIDNYIHFLDEMRKDEKNIWKLLGYINRNEQISHGAPFFWTMSPDDKNSKYYRSYITPQVFALVDLSIYDDYDNNDNNDNNTEMMYKKKYRKKYFQYCKLLFDLTLGKDHNLDPKSPFEVQQNLFDSFCNKIKNDDGYYHLVSAEDALKKYNFDWYTLSKEIGFTKTPSHFVTSSLNYLKCATEVMLKNWTSEKWRGYWIYIYVREITRITEGWLPKTRKFYSEIERGQADLPPPEIRAALYTTLPFNTFLTNEYIDKYQNKEQLQLFQGMGEDLLEVFKRIIKRNTWLASSTKKHALQKLDKMRIIIGSPKKLQPDPILDYKSDDFLENLNKIIEWRLRRFIHLEGKPIIDIPMVDWTEFPIKYSGQQAYIVNASYTPTSNSIFVNLGYVQKPFINLDKKDFAYNLAHLGFTLAHEMSHSLDDLGSQYDADGNLNDWWKPCDKKKFKEIQKGIIKQYNEWAARDGIDYDASIGIGEDIADISGLAICDEYFRDFQTFNKDIAAVQRNLYMLFYTYFAYQQRQKITKKALAAQLKTNPHPLDKYRTNVPLSRSVIFRSSCNIKPGDGMYWHSTDTIW